MRAHRSSEREGEPEVVEVPKSASGPGEVVVRVGAGGVARGDLHVFHHWSPTALPWSWTPPLTLGQEVGAWPPSRALHEGLDPGGAVLVFNWRSAFLPTHAFGLSPEPGG